jgi:5'-nucleotidase
VKLAQLMDEKEQLEAELSLLRLSQQRQKGGYAPPSAIGDADANARTVALRASLEVLDQSIAPLAKASTEQGNQTWGLLTRAGNDKSHLAHQLERYADIYTSRVSNLLAATPFVYMRSPRGSLPHDPSLPGGRPHSQSVD